MKKAFLLDELLGSAAPVLDFKFTTGSAPGLTFSQTTPSTMFNASGLLTYAPNNQVLNSATLSTQSVTSRVSNYILSFTGTGSVVASGTASFTLNGTGASNRVYQIFTPTAGTLTLTVSGSVTNASLAQVMAETSPRTQDLVNTGASAYFGPRYDYDPATLASRGLLVEQASTNLALQSNNFGTTWSTANLSSVVQNATSPDGSADAWTFTDNSTNSFHARYQGITAPINTNIAASWFVAAGTLSAAFINIQSSAGNYITAVFDLTASASTGTASETSHGSSSGTIVSTFYQKLPNGFYRVSIIGSVGVANPTILFGTASLTTGNTFSVAGEVDYAGTGKTLIAYGAQVEALSFPTSYIPTDASAVSRAADVATATLPAACASGGTMQADAMWPSVPGINARLAELSNGSSTNRVIAYVATPHPAAFVEAAGSTIYNATAAGSVSANQNTRINVSWGPRTFAYVNGASMTPASAGAAVPTLTTIYLGEELDGSLKLNGWLQRLTIWCPPLSQLAAQQKSSSW